MVKYSFVRLGISAESTALRKISWHNSMAYKHGIIA